MNCFGISQKIHVIELNKAKMDALLWLSWELKYSTALQYKQSSINEFP